MFSGVPTIWISELSAMLFGAFIMLGGGYTLYRGAHANMDIVYAALPKRGKALLDLITFSLFLAFVGVLFWQGWQMAWRSVLMLEHDSTEWAPPTVLLQNDPAHRGWSSLASRYSEIP